MVGVIDKAANAPASLKSSALAAVPTNARGGGSIWWANDAVISAATSASSLAPFKYSAPTLPSVWKKPYP